MVQKTINCSLIPKVSAVNVDSAIRVQILNEVVNILHGRNTSGKKA